MAIKVKKSLDLTGLITMEGVTTLMLPSFKVDGLKKGNLVGYATDTGDAVIVKEVNKTDKAIAVCLDPDELVFLVSGIIKASFLVEAPTNAQGSYGNVIVLK